MSISVTGVSVVDKLSNFDGVPNTVTAVRYAPSMIANTALSAGSITAGTTMFWHFVLNKTSTFAGMSIETTTSTATATTYIGIYSDNNGRPGTLLYVSALLDTSGTGVVLSTQNMTLIGGVRYWQAMLNLVASPQMRAVAIAASVQNLGIIAATGNTVYQAYTAAAQTSLTPAAETSLTQVAAAIRPTIFLHP